MDQRGLYTTRELAPRLDNLPFAFAFPAQLANPAYRQLLDRLIAPGTLTKLMRQPDRQNAGGRGFYHPTNGDAAYYLSFLRDPRRRGVVLQFFGARLEDFRSDEHLARTLAVVMMLCGLLRMCDTAAKARLDQFD